ncbi:hypothetical protein TNIN_125711 [Trichonephila inaurata madagascariensis]|uniref:Uncharacterized protein n=1 Tax=Trichonephila inaurata madagascariensis TaxID=2747483 RepID=A0A8X6WYZ5_9ARAC|nr:hypothetical protein TNIN_125711 [Trichonephila inaurata madagascariensis]
MPFEEGWYKSGSNSLPIPNLFVSGCRDETGTGLLGLVMMAGYTQRRDIQKGKPSDGGNGQLDRYGRAEISTVGAKGCIGDHNMPLDFLHRWHGMQHRVHLAVSLNMDGQTK